MRVLIPVLATAWLCQAATLRLLVRDPSGASIGNALVSAGNESHRTDAAGEAVFADLRAGRLDVTIAADGFETYSTRINVKSGSITLERTLRLAVHQDQVDVALDPREENTDPRSGLTASELTPEQIEQLPDDPEEMERVLKEMAGPGAVIRVNGFRGGRLPPKSQIQSIRFRLTPYSAEEHDDGFITIDVLTKAGLGEWHGDGNFAFGDDALNARNAFARVREPQQSRRLDLNLMGPLIRNKTSSSFQFSRNDGYDSRVSNGFLPSGPFSDLIRLPNTAMSAGARAQHNLTRAHMLRAEYQFDRNQRSTATNFDLPERVSSTFGDMHQLRLATVGSISERMVTETRFQAQWSSTGSVSVTRAPAVLVQGAFNSGGANADSNRKTQAYELSEHVSFNKGKHAVRAGMQVDHLRQRGRDFTNGWGTTVYSSLQAFLSGDPVQYSRRSAEVSVGYIQNRLAAYFQDDMRLLKNLSFSLGLRQEAMSQISGRTNLAPRVGFAWSPFKHGKTTIRGGGGVFNRWYDAALYEETLRLNGAAQADLVTSKAGIRLPGFLRTAAALDLPYTVRASLGARQQLPGGLNLIADYRHERGLQLFRSRNVNTADSGYGYLLQLENGARSRMDGLFVGISLMPAPDAKGWRSRLFWNAHYFLSRFRDEVSSPLSPPADSSNAHDDWGPASFDVRHRFSSMTQVTVGRGWQASVFFNTSSALPYNVTTGFDANGDTFFNDRPDGSGRNSARGAGQVNVSGRVSWTASFGRRDSQRAGGQMVRIRMDGGNSMPDLGIGGRATRPDAVVRIQFYGQANNLINHVNPTNFVGVITSPLFGQPATALAPRRVEVGIRFGF